LSRACASPY